MRERDAVKDRGIGGDAVKDRVMGGLHTRSHSPRHSYLLCSQTVKHYYLYEVQQPSHHARAKTVAGIISASYHFYGVPLCSQLILWLTGQGTFFPGTAGIIQFCKNTRQNALISFVPFYHAFNR